MEIFNFHCRHEVSLRVETSRQIISLPNKTITYRNVITNTLQNNYKCKLLAKGNWKHPNSLIILKKDSNKPKNENIQMVYTNEYQGIPRNLERLMGLSQTSSLLDTCHQLLQTSFQPHELMHMSNTLSLFFKKTPPTLHSIALVLFCKDNSCSNYYISQFLPLPDPYNFSKRPLSHISWLQREPSTPLLAPLCVSYICSFFSHYSLCQKIPKDLTKNILSPCQISCQNMSGDMDQAPFWLGLAQSRKTTQTMESFHWLGAGKVKLTQGALRNYALAEGSTKDIPHWVAQTNEIAFIGWVEHNEIVLIDTCSTNEIQFIGFLAHLMKTISLGFICSIIFLGRFPLRQNCAGEDSSVAKFCRFLRGKIVPGRISPQHNFSAEESSPEKILHFCSYGDRLLSGVFNFLYSCVSSGSYPNQLLVCRNGKNCGFHPFGKNAISYTVDHITAGTDFALDKHNIPNHC
ncbi:hypothetical protein VP01_3233g2 [Puccinia sorghi]|uniref:Uncharacterized protein n=1 Tax=Puccinia sorghi TaxID=27349 RepID=A0A0L6UZ09_9BASI|nr:hypothetical protein VP01_3233g2 [Puccinia sorghi]